MTFFIPERKTAAETFWETESQLFFSVIIFPQFRDCLIPNEIQLLECRVKYENDPQAEVHRKTAGRAHAVRKWSCEVFVAYFKFWIYLLSTMCIYPVFSRTRWSFNFVPWVTMTEFFPEPVGSRILQWPTSHQKHKNDYQFQKGSILSYYLWHMRYVVPYSLSFQEGPLKDSGRLGLVKCSKNSLSKENKL